MERTIAPFVLVENGLRPLIGQSLFGTLGIYIKQHKTTNKIANCYKTPNPLEQQITEDFRGLISRVVNSKNQRVSSQFHKKTIISSQNGRKIPSKIQGKVKSSWKIY